MKVLQNKRLRYDIALVKHLFTIWRPRVKILLGHLPQCNSVCADWNVPLGISKVFKFQKGLDTRSYKGGGGGGGAILIV